MQVAIYTLGCKVNQYETAALERALRDRGHTLAPFVQAADAYIINTCTVTSVSDQKSRQAIRRAKKQSPHAVVAVCGCYAQTDPASVSALGVDLVAGTADRMKFISDLERLTQDNAPSSSGTQEPCPAPMVTVDNIMSHRAFEPLSAGGMEGRTRAYLKVEDGCVNFCSYCVIPYARGPVRSLPRAEAVAQARRLEEQGYRELVLTGIEISSWGRDLEGSQSLIELVEAVCGAVPGLRVRLGSLEPRTITPDFCRRAAALPNLCPHFHLSLQSGCDGVLKRMNRKYDTDRYYESVKLLRVAFSDPGITTDLIVGFPGETEEEFQETLAFVARAGFSKMHIFPYSRRSGTPAASASDQVPGAVKQARAKRAAALGESMERDFLARRVGTRVQVLFEDEKDGLWRGHTPEYLEVRAAGADLHNRIVPVDVTAAAADHLSGLLTQPTP